MREDKKSSFSELTTRAVRLRSRRVKKFILV